MLLRLTRKKRRQEEIPNTEPEQIHSDALVLPTDISTPYRHTKNEQELCLAIVEQINLSESVENNLHIATSPFDESLENFIVHTEVEDNHIRYLSIKFLIFSKISLIFDTFSFIVLQMFRQQHHPVITTIINTVKDLKHNNII